MAKSAVNVQITQSPGYTVPTGKYFIGKAFPLGVLSGSAQVRVSGTAIFPISTGSTNGVGPIQANAGDVISMVTADTVSLTGFIFDAT